MHLTKPLNVTPADESTSEIEERLMYVVPPLVAHLQPPGAIEPRERPFHNPPVASQPLAGFDAPSGYPRGYAPLPERLAAAGEVVALVCVQLLGALARAAAGFADRLDGIHGLFQDLGVVDVGSRVDHRERDASPVDHNMALRARFALIRRIRSGFLAPRGRQRSPSPRMPSPSRSRRLGRGGRASPRGGAPTRPLRATP